MKSKPKYNKEYWRCKCLGGVTKNINSKIQESCSLCGRHQNSSPDALQSDVETCLIIQSLEKLKGME